MKTNSIPVEKFVNVMSSITGCQFCSLSYTTDAEHMSKKLIGGTKNPYYGKLQAITDITGCQFNANYENAVNNRLYSGKKGEKSNKSERFTAEALPWGTWLTPNKVIAHKDNYYLRLYMTKSTKKAVTYILNGNVVTDENVIADIEASIRQNKPSGRQSEYGVNEEDQVKPFTLNVTDIHHVSIDGKKMVIIH